MIITKKLIALCLTIIIIINVFYIDMPKVNAEWPFTPYLYELPDIHSITYPDIYAGDEYEDYQYVLYYYQYNGGGNKILQLSTTPCLAFSMSEYGPYYSFAASDSGKSILFEWNSYEWIPDSDLMMENNATGAGSILYCNYDVEYASTHNLMKAAFDTDPPVYENPSPDPDYYFIYPGDAATFRYDGTGSSVIIGMETYDASFETIWSGDGVPPQSTSHWNISSYDEWELEPGDTITAWNLIEGSIVFVVPPDPDIYRNITSDDPGGNVIPTVLTAGDSITMRNDGMSPSVLIDNSLNNATCEYVWLYGGGEPNSYQFTNHTGSYTDEMEVGDEWTIWKITTGSVEVDVPDDPNFYYSITRAGTINDDPFDYINPPVRSDYDAGLFGGIQYGIDTVIFIIGYPFIALTYLCEKFVMYLNTLLSSIGSMNSAMAGFVSWMPPEVIAMLVLGIVAGVILKILGR